MKMMCWLALDVVTRWLHCCSAIAAPGADYFTGGVDARGIAVCHSFQRIVSLTAIEEFDKAGVVWDNVA